MSCVVAAASFPSGVRESSSSDLSLSLSLCPRSIARAGLSYNTIFEEIPIKISNISLVKAFLAELEDNDFLDRGAEFDRLSDVSSDAFLEKGNAAASSSLSPASTRLSVSVTSVLTACPSPTLRHEVPHQVD
jgi:hypothetical protein